MVEIMFGETIAARGEPCEMAIFLGAFITAMSKFKEAEDEKRILKELENSDWANITFEELMKRERGENDK